LISSLFCACWLVSFYVLGYLLSNIPSTCKVPVPPFCFFRPTYPFVLLRSVPLTRFLLSLKDTRVSLIPGRRLLVRGSGISPGFIVEGLCLPGKFFPLARRPLSGPSPPLPLIRWPSPNTYIVHVHFLRRPSRPLLNF